MKCPLCLNPATVHALTGRDFLFEATPKNFSLDSCPQCRCLFLNPMPDRDELAGFYPSEYWWNAATPGLLKRLEWVYRRLALRDHVAFIAAAGRNAAGSRLLDFGCGSGTLLGILKTRGFQVVGVDSSEEAARVAERENGVRVIAGSLEDARFPAHSFDVVTMFHVMEHVTNPRQILAEVSRILKPSGRVVIQVPNIDSWQFRIFGARWYGLDIPRHVIDYSRNSMLRLLEACGFEARRVRHFNLRDNAPALASSLLPSLDPVSRSIRQRRKSGSEAAVVAWMRHLMYLSLVFAAYPVAIIESAAGHGATIMIEASKAGAAANESQTERGREEP
jgi:2-polyprenyl-3-methyl-5-hydroxy-6-metoxy-1,4-benzoquinol methylase